MNFCKTDDFHKDLKKLLSDEAKKSLESSRMCAKENNYFDAAKFQEDAHLCQFILLEIAEYEKTGRWM